MLYFKFKDHEGKTVEDDCLKTSDFTEHFPSDLSHVDTWYLEYEDEDEEYEEGYVSCEVGLYDDGGYAVLAPHDDFYGFWLDSDMTIEGFQRQHGFQMITKDEFDKVLNGCIKAMTETSIYEAVNDFLADWNPIGGIPRDMAKIEYTSYVPGIVNALDDWYKLKSCLYSLLKSIGMSEYFTEKEVNDVTIRLRRLKFLHRSPDVYVRFDNYGKPEWKGSYMLQHHDEVVSWYVHYDNKQKRVLRDVGLDESGNVLTSASYLYRLCKRYENFPFKDGCVMYIITKDQFERAYGSTDDKEEGSCTPESKQEDVCASAVNYNDDTCEPCQEQDVVEEKKKMPFLLSVIRALVLFVLVCFVLYVVLFLGMLKFLIV